VANPSPVRASSDDEIRANIAVSTASARTFSTLTPMTGHANANKRRAMV
jgi:hypothetical protein